MPIEKPPTPRSELFMDNYGGGKSQLIVCVFKLLMNRSSF